MKMLASAPIGGEKTALLAFATHMVGSTSHSVSGMAKSETLSNSIISQALISISEILKERLFGISSEEGNHGQSIKEAHFHIDNVPTVCPRYSFRRHFLTVRL